jgi:FHS family L-fucose permease-like MFS transporter
MGMTQQNNTAPVAGTGDEPAGTYTYALSAMTTLFFIWGFLTALNDILIPHLKGEFDLNYTQAMLIQFCFFGAYFIVSPFAGKLVEKIGYRKGVVAGLLVMAFGCVLFYPAADFKVYTIFLVALFILASGITVLQVSANPYVAVLGPSRTAASRLNLSQAINSLGHTLGPLFGASLILAGAVGADAVQMPYLMLAGVMVIVATVFFFLKLPVIRDVEDAESAARTTDSIWNHKPLLFGVLAIFLYVGAEVSIGGFLVNYFTMERIGGLSEVAAGRMVSYYWGAAMIGRFFGAAVMRYVQPTAMLAFNGLAAIVLIMVTITSGGDFAMWSILAVGFFNSVMFPTVFTLAIRGLGPLTGQGSGLLCQAIVGGAVLPMLQGAAADAVGIQLSFAIPAFCYSYIIWYALKGSRLDDTSPQRVLPPILVDNS